MAGQLVADAGQRQKQGLAAPQRRLAVAVIVLGTLMAVLDLGMVTIALPTIAQDLGVPTAKAVWVATTYQLVCAGSLLFFAALSHLIGHKRVYTAGLVLFTSGCLGAVLSTDLATLLLSRGVEGLGAAAILSLGPSLYRIIFPCHLLGRAIGLNALVVAAGLASGPSLGGLLLSIANWPWLFALNVPAGLLAIWLAGCALPREPIRRGHFDWLGALLSMLMLGGFLLAVGRLGHAGSYTLSFTLVLISVCSAGLFLWRQNRAPVPLVPLAMFLDQRFSSALVITGLAFTAQGAAFVALPVWYQNVMGLTALQAAFFFTSWPLALLLSGPLAGRLADSRDPALLSTSGLALFLAGMAALAWLSGKNEAMYLVLPSLLCGLGYGFFQAPNNREIMSSVPLEMSARASGVLASVRTFGQCLGSALVALVMAFSLGSVQLALWLGCALVLAALLISIRRLALPLPAHLDETCVLDSEQSNV